MRKEIEDKIEENKIKLKGGKKWKGKKKVKKILRKEDKERRKGDMEKKMKVLIRKKRKGKRIWREKRIENIKLIMVDIRKREKRRICKMKDLGGVLWNLIEDMNYE